MGTPPSGLLVDVAFMKSTKDPLCSEPEGLVEVIVCDISSIIAQCSYQTIAI